MNTGRTGVYLTNMDYHMPGQSLGHCWYFSHVSMPPIAPILYQTKCEPSLSARELMRSPLVTSRMLPRWPDIWLRPKKQDLCLAMICTDMIHVKYFCIDNWQSSGGFVVLLVYSFRHNKYCDLISCHDKSNTVVVTQATLCTVGPSAMVADPSETSLEPNNNCCRALQRARPHDHLIVLSTLSPTWISNHIPG